MKNQYIDIKDTNSEMAKKAMEEKLYRTKLYQEDKENYKKRKKEFVFCISQHFRQRRNNLNLEMKRIEEETLQADQEGDTMNLVIRVEKESDYFYVETMTRESFWNVYKPGCDEHVMVHKLRNTQEFLPELDFVAECDGKVVGNVICTLAKIVDEQRSTIHEKSIVAIGPICVLPQYQKRGIGSMLINEVKKVAKELGYRGLVLYGDPSYYHRFGFVNAKEYSITNPDGSNMDAFMVFELEEHSLDGICGRYYESEAFEVSKDELNRFERNFIGKYERNQNQKSELNQGNALNPIGGSELIHIGSLDSVSIDLVGSNLDYTRIKEEFKNAGVNFPLLETTCKGLTDEEKLEINPCGTYCGDCEDYGVVCDGCRNRKGMPIWYHLYSKKEPCSYYTCVEKNNFHDCSQCQQVPCNKFFEYPDPNMSDDCKQMWFKLRMNHFNQLNCTRQIEIKDDFKKNEEYYANK